LYKRVLIPVDGSDLAESIVPFILQIAGPLDLDVILLRVNAPIPPLAFEGTRYVELDDIEARREEAQLYLDQLGAAMRRAGVRVHTRVRRGDPVQEILSATGEEG